MIEVSSQSLLSCCDCLRWKEMSMKWRCLFCRSQLPVHLNISVCVCSLRRPTLGFHVARSHKLCSVRLRAPFVVFSTVWCCVRYCRGVSTFFPSCFVIGVIALFWFGFFCMLLFFFFFFGSFLSFRLISERHTADCQRRFSLVAVSFSG